jgi:hypothetical protein
MKNIVSEFISKIQKFDPKNMKNIVQLFDGIVSVCVCVLLNLFKLLIWLSI